MNDHARSLAEDRQATPPEPARQYVLQALPDEEVDGAAAAVPDGDGGDHGAIVAESPTQIERLTVGEAVMRMDLAHVPVLMFRNRATGALNVVYRRPDGHVGWIDPSAD